MNGTVIHIEITDTETRRTTVAYYSPLPRLCEEYKSCVHRNMPALVDVATMRYTLRASYRCDVHDEAK